MLTFAERASVKERECAPSVLDFLVLREVDPVRRCLVAVSTLQLDVPGEREKRRRKFRRETVQKSNRFKRRKRNGSEEEEEEVIQMAHHRMSSSGVRSLRHSKSHLISKVNFGIEKETKTKNIK